MAEQFGIGLLQPSGWGDEFNATAFLVRQMIARLSTMTLVRVAAVNVESPGAIGPSGTVDVEPLVSQIDGNGNAIPRGTIYGIPFFRVGTATMQIVCDPQVGDIGMVVAADRDTSSARAAKKQATPGSRRMYSYSDGVYVGALLLAQPPCYVAMTKSGDTHTITMSPDAGTTFLKLEPGKITLTADEIITHAVSKNAWDVNGVGFVYTPSLISTYTNGVPSSANAPHPPEVPV